MSGDLRDGGQGGEDEWESVTEVLTTSVDDHCYAVTEHVDGYDGTAVRVWDLATREELTGDDWPEEITELVIGGNELVPAVLSVLVNRKGCSSAMISSSPTPPAPPCRPTSPIDLVRRCVSSSGRCGRGSGRQSWSI
ncbi:hypothetical protein ACFU53_30510 [Streptomyces sp. NPDC057474]|uniref:hypothetical protein n=1 Tax=Streptomyces sp. NPDC057474 TaxID=3346144 RepID=UPI0036B6E78F